MITPVGANVTLTVRTQGDLADALQQADAATAVGTTYTIDLASGIGTLLLSSDLPAINLAPGVGLLINGNGATLNAAGATRGLLASAGSVIIENLMIANGVARGGNGGSGGLGGGGGGAGLGGDLLIGPLADGEINNVSLLSGSAIGGNGGAVGSGGGGGNGRALGAGMFLMNTVTFAPASGTTDVISDAITGQGNGLGGIAADGPGRLELDGGNSYSGATTITQGTLIIGNANPLTCAIADNSALVFGDAALGEAKQVVSMATSLLPGSYLFRIVTASTGASNAYAVYSSGYTLVALAQALASGIEGQVTNPTPLENSVAPAIGFQLDPTSGTTFAASILPIYGSLNYGVTEQVLDPDFLKITALGLSGYYVLSINGVAVSSTGDGEIFYLIQAINAANIPGVSASLNDRTGQLILKSLSGALNLADVHGSPLEALGLSAPASIGDQVDAGPLSGAGSLEVAVNGGTLSLAGADTFTGASGLIVSGAGVLTLSGSNSVAASAGVTINGPELELASANALNGAAVTFGAAGGTLRIDQALAGQTITVDHFTSGDSILLAGYALPTALSLTSGTLTLSGGSWRNGTVASDVSLILGPGSDTSDEFTVTQILSPSGQIEQSIQIVPAPGVIQDGPTLAQAMANLPKANLVVGSAPIVMTFDQFPVLSGNSYIYLHGTISLDANGRINLPALQLANDEPLTINGSLLDGGGAARGFNVINGHLTVNVANLTNLVGPVGSSGALQVGAGATLTFAGSVSGGSGSPGQTSAGVMIGTGGTLELKGGVLGDVIVGSGGLLVDPSPDPGPVFPAYGLVALGPPE